VDAMNAPTRRAKPLDTRPSTAPALMVAAVAGEPHTEEELAAIGGMGEDQARKVIRILEAAGVVERMQVDRRGDRRVVLVTAGRLLRRRA
jgi:DNA-binding MarR family transcriptional regulator